MSHAAGKRYNSFASGWYARYGRFAHSFNDTHSPATKAGRALLWLIWRCCGSGHPIHFCLFFLDQMLKEPILWKPWVLVALRISSLQIPICRSLLGRVSVLQTRKVYFWAASTSELPFAHPHSPLNFTTSWGFLGSLSCPSNCLAGLLNPSPSLGKQSKT